MNTRELTIEHSQAKESERSVPVVLSTEYPVERTWGIEVLDHHPDSVDLSRAPLPLIESHDNSQINIGLVDDLRVVNKKLRGTLKLGFSARAEEIWTDIKAGIIRNVSIGYEIIKQITEPNGVVRVIQFMPYELSLVSTPADPLSGINRCKGIQMTEAVEKIPRGERKRANAQLMAEKERIDEIREVGKFFEAPELAQQWIDSGDSADGFRLMMHERAKREFVPAVSPDIGRGHEFYGIDQRDLKRFSIRKAVLACIDPSKFARDAGFEIEVSNHIAQQRGKELASGFHVPLSLPQQRDITFAGTGSNLVSTDHMAGEFIDVLRNRSILMRLPTTKLSGLQGNVAIPTKTGTSTAYWIDNDGSALTESDPAFGQVTLTPKTVGGLVDITRRTLMQSSPSVEALIQEDLADMLAVEIDAKGIAGDGTGNTPVGTLNTAGIGSTTYANGGSPDFADIVALEGTIASANADGSSIAYLVTPQLMTKLKSTDVGTDTGQFVYTTGKEPGQGRMNGLPAYYSGNVPAGYAIAGNWASLIVAEWGSMEIDVDPYGTNFASGTVSIRAFMDVDFNVRHAGAFAEIHEG